MTLSWDVLSTLTPVDYLAFRDVLGTSSGFQSAQFRELEYRLGLKDPSYLHIMLKAPTRASGSRPRSVARAYAMRRLLRWRGAGSMSATDRPKPSPWPGFRVYRDADRWFELYQLAEKLVDLDDALAMWRHKHVLTVERIIGNKRGTGGSAGAPYLRATLEKRIFPELWALRTDL